MSISATSPSWNAVEIASRSPKRSSAHSRSSHGSAPSNSIESSPASRSSSSSTCSCCSSSRRGVFAGSRPASSAELRRRRCGRRTPGSPRRPRAARASRRQAGDRVVELVGRDPAEHRPRRSPRRGRARRAGRRRTPGGACPRSSRAVDPWKPMSPTQCCAQACGQPSRWSRRSATSSPKRARGLDQGVEPRLRLGDGEVAVRLARAGDRAAADRVGVERKPSSVEPLARRASTSRRRRRR